MLIHPTYKVIVPTHPSYGKLDTSLTIHLSSKQRQNVLSLSHSVDLANSKQILQYDVSLAIASIHDYDKQFITDLNELYDVSNRWLVTQILSTHHELEMEFNKGLEDCLQELEAFWQGQKVIGDNNVKDLYKTMKANYERGWLTETLSKQFEQDMVIKERMFRETPFIPKKIITKTWNSFSSLRSSTNSEKPISYDSIESYMNITGHDLTPIEINAIRIMDNHFLSEQSKSRHK